MHSTEQTFLHKMHIDTSQFDVDLIMIEKKKKFNSKQILNEMCNIR